MKWTHTYRKGQITPGGTITAQKPGNSIAQAIEEIQEKAVTDVALSLDSSLTGTAAISQNTLRLSLAVTNPRPYSDEDPDEDSGQTGGGDSLPAGGELYQVLQRNADGEAVWDYVRAVDV
jgi:hypothetical protein